MFEELKRKYKEILTRPESRKAIIWGIVLFALAVAVQGIADRYVGRVKSVAVPDLILDHIPSLDIDGLIVQGVLWLTGISIVLTMLKPKYLSFSLKTIALFVVIRAGLISLTHLGVNPHQLVFSPDTFGYGIYNALYNTNNDFFFSAHTGIPLLGAFIYWQEKRWRNFYLVASALFGAAMLFAHIHYSIDVIAAPFMTYSIFKFSGWLFKKDLEFTKHAY